MTDRWTASSPPYAPPPPQGPGLGMILVLSFLVALIAAAGLHLVLDRTRGASAQESAPAPPATRVVVPDLIGLTIGGARSRAELDGFLLHLAARDALGPDALDRGVITAQRPLAGSLIRADDVVEAFIGGPTAVADAPRAAPTADADAGGPAAAQARARTVPDVAGLSLAEATRALREAELVVGDVMEVASPDKEPGFIVTQTPAAGAEAAEGSAVAVAVTAAPETVTVPPLARVDADTARSRLAAVGLRARVDAIFSPTVPSGHVVQVKPASGTEVEPGSLVLVYIAE